MPPVGFEPTISAGERPQAYTLTLLPLESAVPWTRTVNSRRYQRKEKFVQTFQCQNLKRLGD